MWSEIKARNNRGNRSILIVCDHSAMPAGRKGCAGFKSVDKARYGHGPADAIEMPPPFDASGGGRSDRIDDDENDDARRRRKAGEPKKAPANPQAIRIRLRTACLGSTGQGRRQPCPAASYAPGRRCSALTVSYESFFSPKPVPDPGPAGR